MFGTVGLGSIDAVVWAVERAREVALSTYILPPGKLRRALERAGDRGTHVAVELEGAPYAPTAKEAEGMRRFNLATVAELKRHGVDACLRTDDDAPLHLKAALVDGTAFLDDRNWTDDGREAILCTDRAADVDLIRRSLAGNPGNDGDLATRKDAALQLEAATIEEAPAGAGLRCESESFGPSRISRDLAARARSGESVRLLVNGRHLAARTLGVLSRLQAAGVEVRLGNAAEKLCLAGDAGWLGSANATSGRPGTLDWGMRTRAPALVAALGERFEERWGAARPFAPRAA